MVISWFIRRCFSGVYDGVTKFSELSR